MEPGPVIPGAGPGPVISPGLGGWNPTLPNPPNTATPEIQQMVAKLKPQLQEKLNMDLGQCQALFYYNQLVEGMNYLILVSQL